MRRRMSKVRGPGPYRPRYSVSAGGSGGSSGELAGSLGSRLTRRFSSALRFFSASRRCFS